MYDIDKEIYPRNNVKKVFEISEGMVFQIPNLLFSIQYPMKWNTIDPCYSVSFVNYNNDR